MHDTKGKQLSGVLRLKRFVTGWVENRRNERVKKGRKTLQGFLAALLIFKGILISGGTAWAAESVTDVKTGMQRTVQAEASLIADEIPIAEISAAAEKERTTEEVRIGVKTSDVTEVQASIFRYACSAMFVAMLFLAELLHMQKREKEGE